MKTRLIFKQATALASECIEYLDQTQPIIRDPTTTPVNQTITQPIQRQNQDPGLSTASLCPPDIQAAHGSCPTATSDFLPSTDTSVLQAFQDTFLQFSTERFQEVKAQAGALQGSRGMQVWNVAWLRCREARQQLHERMQGVEDVSQHQADSSSLCELHYVDVVSTNVQSPSSGGRNLVVQSTPGPGHPQWEGIVSGAVDVGKRRPILGRNNTTSTNAACCNVTSEDHSDAGTSQGSNVTPQSPQR